MQALVSSLRGRPVQEEHVERFRCLLGDCADGRSPRQLPQWPQWVKYRNSLRGLYTVGDYNDDPARLRALTILALIVTGAQTVSFHRAMNEALLRTLPHAEPWNSEPVTIRPRPTRNTSLRSGGGSSNERTCPVSPRGKAVGCRVTRRSARKQLCYNRP